MDWRLLAQRAAAEGSPWPSNRLKPPRPVGMSLAISTPSMIDRFTFCRRYY